MNWYASLGDACVVVGAEEDRLRLGPDQERHLEADQTQCEAVAQLHARGEAMRISADANCAARTFL
jgi:hypothetical protein